MSKKKKTPSLPSFEKLQAVIELFEQEGLASEVHGNLCGFLCAGDLEKAQVYITTLVEDLSTEKYEHEIKALISLFEITRAQLNSGSFDFHLLLPDDDEALEWRAKNLGQWCHGFSDGVLQTGIDIAGLNTEDARDALFHITEIANIDYQNTLVTEEDEKAFAEIYEYVRMAVLMIQTEMAGASEAGGSVNSQTLH